MMHFRLMITVTEEEAAEQFGKFVQMANAGQRIIITHDGKPWVVLQALPERKESPRSVQWPNYPAHWKKSFPEGTSQGPTATELLARDKEDRF
jgi:antitoxin (DNA-binding transcriptional repressor) of toxin-antitoxin stability system